MDKKFTVNIRFSMVGFITSLLKSGNFLTRFILYFSQSSLCFQFLLWRLCYCSRLMEYNTFCVFFQSHFSNPHEIDENKNTRFLCVLDQYDDIFLMAPFELSKKKYILKYFSFKGKFRYFVTKKVCYGYRIHVSELGFFDS